MTANYNYKTKDCMKSDNYASSSAVNGVKTIAYAENFENVPITIASMTDANAITNTNVVSTCIYSPLVSGFSAISYYKDATTGLAGGGPINYGLINYFSVDNTAILTYTYKNSPIIQSGTFTIPSPGTTQYTVTFANAFQNEPIVVVCPSGNVNEVITSYIVSTTSSNFNVISLFKDGANNGDGGGYYYGNFNYIAVDNTAISTYTSNGGPIIKCGTFTTANNGTYDGIGTVTGLGFNTGSVKVFFNPRGINTIMISCCITSVSSTQFSVSSFWKDGSNGGKNGGAINASFNYIAITS
jgi:hypothetical protein